MCLFKKKNTWGSARRQERTGNPAGYTERERQGHLPKKTKAKTKTTSLQTWAEA